MPNPPRLTRQRVTEALRWVADGRVPEGAGSRTASAEELVGFARAALAPVAGDCRWCRGAGCPACEIDRDRALLGLVLRIVQERGPEVTGRTVRDHVGGRPDLVGQALDVLRREGLVVCTGERGRGRPAYWSVVPAADLPRVRSAA